LLPVLRFSLEVVRGAALCDRGDPTRGLTALQQARSEFGDEDGPVELLAAVAVLEFRAALDLGHLTAARTVRGWLSDRAGPCSELELMRACTGTVGGHEQQARALLRPVLEGATYTVLPQTLVEAWLLECSLSLLSDERPAARHALLTALALAEPIDSLRPFVKSGPLVRELLVAQQGSFGTSNTFAARAVRAVTLTRSNTMKVLSERELTVLQMLPSLLSLVDIAADLTISVNTVKSHVRSIYTKLGVSSRRHAVLAA